MLNFSGVNTSIPWMHASQNVKSKTIFWSLSYFIYTFFTPCECWTEDIQLMSLICSFFLLYHSNICVCYFYTLFISIFYLLFEVIIQKRSIMPFMRVGCLLYIFWKLSTILYLIFWFLTYLLLFLSILKISHFLFLEQLFYNLRPDLI